MLKEHYKNKNSNISLSLVSSNEFFNGAEFLNNFKKSLLNKKIIATSVTCNQLGSFSYVYVDAFYRTRKVYTYKKQVCSKTNDHSLVQQKKLQTLQAYFVSKEQVATFIHFNNLNSRIKKLEMLFLYGQLKKFNNTIFPRRFSYFLDFIKITILFKNGQVDSATFLAALGDTFRILPKRKHTLYLNFIKILFDMLTTSTKLNSKILGIKLIVNGKLQGKTRASFAKIRRGKIPLQTLKNKISFNKLHAYTLYGVFGFNLWVNLK